MEGLGQAASGAGCRVEAESRLVMIRFKPAGELDGKLQVLCLGCHSDDIEIGCGGTMLHLAAEYPDAEFNWVVFSATGLRETEARQGARRFVASARLKSLT